MSIDSKTNKNYAMAKMSIKLWIRFIFDFTIMKKIYFNSYVYHLDSLMFKILWNETTFEFRF